MNNKNFVLLSVGANVGNKKSTILNAYKMIQEAGILENVTLSSFYETEPVGVKNQPWFLNAAISGYTDINNNELITMLKSIEYALGRKPRERWHEREIDLDILLYGNNKIETKPLTVPHPRMHQRRFVLLPASEIAGNAIHPVFGLSINSLLQNCEDKSEVNLTENSQLSHND
jgi:2-amino-4-hydroxy-6-hydroxymethyldihydropteridine diphosphokinase